MNSLEADELTPEARARLLTYFHYPAEWSFEGLYPEAVARLQLAEVLSELGISRDAFVSLPPEHSREWGSEHFRTAAILFWLRQPRTPEMTAALKAALRSDSNKPMARAFLRELENETPPILPTWDSSSP